MSCKVSSDKVRTWLMIAFARPKIPKRWAEKLLSVRLLDEQIHDKVSSKNSFAAWV